MSAAWEPDDARLARMEREIVVHRRLMVVAMLVAVSALALVLWRETRKQATPVTIEAQRFVLRDGSGVQQGEWTVKGERGFPQLVVGRVAEDLPRIVLSNRGAIALVGGLEHHLEIWPDKIDFAAPSRQTMLNVDGLSIFKRDTIYVFPDPSHPTRVMHLEYPPRPGHPRQP